MRKMVDFGENELGDQFEMNWHFKYDVCCGFESLFMFVIKCISFGVEFGVEGIKIGDFGWKMV